ncbi:hypothetical protein B0A50_00501 [Salinomyces thailandicus]|uniref:Uncharacterized protein n=1 Tax=Salinomyces thailandicus TaxID=706561 RepID=A0A4U0UGN8_9PEZI|nr:hypothetical protein B0A50_00501 [Salinomyces thailandica]
MSGTASRSTPRHYNFYYTRPARNDVTQILKACLGDALDQGYNPMKESSLRRHPTVPTLPDGRAVWWSFDSTGGVDQFNMIVTDPPAPPAAENSAVSSKDSETEGGEAKRGEAKRGEAERSETERSKAERSETERSETERSETEDSETEDRRNE